MRLREKTLGDLTYPLSIVVFSERSVNPVDDVETTISPANMNSIKELCVCSCCIKQWQSAKYLPEKQDIVSSEVVNVLCPLQQHQLWQNCYCFQVQRECPQDLHYKTKVHKCYTTFTNCHLYLLLTSTIVNC